jgi:cytoskeletal protein CcmA (bactofilin family)
MNKFKLALVLVLVALGSGVLWTSITSAQTIKTGSSVTTTNSETIDSSLYTAGTDLTIESNVNGDIFCAGQNVIISGTVNGDVLCLAQTITISGTVNGDIRIAAQTANLSGVITGNATVASSSFIVESSGSVDGDLTIASGTVTVIGQIGRDVLVTSGSLNVDGNIGRNITGDLENLIISDSAVVSGNIDYTSINEAEISENAQVLGVVSRSAPEQGGSGTALFGISLAFLVYILISALIVSMVLVLIAPRFFNSVTNHAYPKPWKALLVGAIVAFIVPLLGFILIITVFGIPLALTLGVGYLFVALLSGPFTAYLVGRWVMNKSTKPLLIMLVGSVVLLLTYIVPVIGFFALLFAYWTGVGMLTLELYYRNPNPSYNFEQKEIKKPATTKKSKK